MGEPGQQHLILLKQIEELDRDEKLVFRSGSDAPSSFSKST